MFHCIRRPGFNRNIVEGKDHRQDECFDLAVRFNRNIVECKEKRIRVQIGKDG